MNRIITTSLAATAALCAMIPGTPAANATIRTSAAVARSEGGNPSVSDLDKFLNAARVDIQYGELNRPPHIVIPQNVQRLLRDDPGNGQYEFARQFCEAYRCAGDTDWSMAQMFAAYASSTVHSRGTCPDNAPHLWMNFARQDEGCRPRVVLLPL